MGGGDHRDAAVLVIYICGESETAGDADRAALVPSVHAHSFTKHDGKLFEYFIPVDCRIIILIFLALEGGGRTSKLPSGIERRAGSTISYSQENFTLVVRVV